MRLSLCIATLFLVPLLLSSAILTTQIHSPNQLTNINGEDDDKDEDGSRSGFWSEREKVMDEKKYSNMKRGRTLEIALGVGGSRIPDCSHARGSCTPCRLKVVSFTCADAAETCPISYRCFCNCRSYQLP